MSTKKTRRQRAAKRAAARAMQAAQAGDSTEMALSCPLSIEAAKTDDDGKSKARRFTMNAYNGGPVNIDHYPLPAVIDIRGMRIPRKTTPAYYGHSRERIVGHIDQHDKTDGTRFLAAGAISGATEYSRQVLESTDAGFPWQASVSVLPDASKLVELPPGKTAKVNGRTIEGPAIIARASTLRHIAFVPEGADVDSSVSIAASAATSNQKGRIMTFQQWVEALGFDFESLTDAQQMALQAKYDAEMQAQAAGDGATAGQPGNGNGDASGVQPPEFNLSAVIMACEKHTAAIQAATAAYEGKIDGAKLVELRQKAGLAAAELKSKALDEEWAPARVEVEAMRLASDLKVELVRAERPQAPAIHASRRDATPAVIEAALCMSAGYPLADAERAFSEQTLDAANRMYRNLGLQDLLLMQAEARGYAGGRRINRSNLREVLKAAFPMEASQHSTLSVSGILSNIANKFLLLGYNHVEQVWRQIANIRPVNDFKTMTSYRLTGDFTYKQVGPTGQLEHAEVGEESYTIGAKTYGRVFGLTREDIINDDLGAFNDLRRRLGRGAALKLNEVFWAAFLDNASFFTSGRGNYFEGADTALSADALRVAAQMFRDLEDADGNPVGADPALLLVPTALEVKGRELYVSTEMRDTTASTRRPIANVFQNQYRPIVSAYLSKTRFTGASSKAWYLLADPADRPTMEVCFLNGVEQPVVEQGEPDFDTLGVLFRGYHDFGVAQKEYLGGVKAKGEV